MPNLSSALNAAVSRPSAIRMALDEWRGKAIRLTDGEFWSQFSGRESSSGIVVNPDKAMQLSAVWACVRLISETVSTLPLSLYRREPDGGRVSAKDHRLYDILHYQPNADMTAVQFWESAVASMLLRGNAFVRKHYIGSKLVSLEPLLPQRITVQRQDDGSLKYTYQPRKGAAEIIPEREMMHIPAFSFDGVMGLSAVYYGANVMGAAISADTAASSTFQNGLHQTVAFKVDRILSKEQRAEFREYVKEISGALNAGKSPVLEQGVTPETIGISPTDAQLLESRGFSVEEIARWFRVPPWMIGHTQNTTSWGTGIEQQMIGFLTFSLRPWLARIEQAIRRSLLEPAERATLYAEFGLEGLLRADSSARAEFYSKMAQNGIMSRDDCRVLENLPRMGGNASVLTVQTNLSPIDLLGAKTDSAQAREALLSWLNKE